MASSIAAGAAPIGASQARVIFGASLGTVFEWYDFYLYASLAGNIGAQFFTGLTPTGSYIVALLVFAAGFFVRPFGALLFGRLGDMAGRKYTFLITILIMGASTFLVGLLPGYQAIGPAAPALLIFLRLAQGLALGGEYGGAAIYVAEHAPPGRRGAYTAWIQTTATLGLLLSLIVIMLVQTNMAEADFAVWGWRIPFLLSIILLGISIWIRLRLNESPVFQRMKAAGTQSIAPLTESFTRWPNLKLVLIALFGATAGEAVVWYAGQFYAQSFLIKTLLIAPVTANLMLAVALGLGVPFFLIFGALSDRIGRKPIILAGCLLCVLTYFPIFHGLTHYGNPALEAAIAKAPVVVAADPATCSVQFNPVGTAKFTSSCDVAKAALVARGVPYHNATGPADRAATITVGDTAIESYAATAPDAKDKAAAFKTALGAALGQAGYPAKADPAGINQPMVILLLFVLVLYVTMAYAPLAAALVELFPTRIRYTSMSLPYHIGNGWFGGFLPATAVAIVAATGDIYSGLWYPIIIAGVTVVVGALFLRETKDVSIEPEG